MFKPIKLDDMLGLTEFLKTLIIAIDRLKFKLLIPY